MKKTFLGVLFIIEEMINKGLLHKDPANDNNIILCRMIDGKEKWVSQNIHLVASETFNSPEKLEEFITVAKEHGIDTDSLFKKASDLLGIEEEFSAEKFVKNLTPSQKDEVYRLLWSDYVKEDVESLTTDEEVIDRVVNAYVYSGDYDCNLSYWDNLENLISKLS